MNSIIEMLTALFILSMANERICDFIKLQYSEKSFFFGLIHFKNLKRKEFTNEELEKIRTKRILTINLVTAWIVSLILKADMIAMLSGTKNISSTIGWPSLGPFEWYYVITIPIGCFLTGCFLSLGSKFWHDTIDLILQVKNIKRDIAETTEINRSKLEMQEVDDKRMNDFVEQALKPYQYDSFTIDVDTNTVTVSNPAVLTPMPKTIQYKNLVGQVVTLSVATIDGEIKAFNALVAGDQVAHKFEFNDINFGSLGYFFKGMLDQKQYFLTCYHCVWTTGLDWTRYTKNGSETEIVHPRDGDRIGILEFAERNAEHDVALIHLDSNIDWSQVVPGLGSITKSRQVDFIDKKYKTRVKKLGFTTDLTTGFISDYNKKARIRYPDGSRWELRDLVLIRSNSSQRFSDSGDSGSMVIDENGYAVAIIVASDGNTTYAMPLDKILAHYNLNFNV